MSNFQCTNSFGERENMSLSSEEAIALAAALPNKILAAGSMLVNPAVGALAPVAKTIQQVSNLLPAKAGITAVVAIATADATDPAETMALANINKAKINEILAALKVVS